jgi:hypothetical protein
MLLSYLSSFFKGREKAPEGEFYYPAMITEKLKRADTFKHLFFRDDEGVYRRVVTLVVSEEMLHVSLQGGGQAKAKRKDASKRLEVRLVLNALTHEGIKELIAAGAPNDDKSLSEMLGIESGDAERLLLWSGEHEERDTDGFDLRGTGLVRLTSRPKDHNYQFWARVSMPQGDEERYFVGECFDELYEQAKKNILVKHSAIN